MRHLHFNIQFHFDNETEKLKFVTWFIKKKYKKYKEFLIISYLYSHFIFTHYFKWNCCHFSFVKQNEINPLLSIYDYEITAGRQNRREQMGANGKASMEIEKLKRQSQPKPNRNGRQHVDYNAY